MSVERLGQSLASVIRRTADGARQAPGMCSWARGPRWASSPLGDSAS